MKRVQNIKLNRQKNVVYIPLSLGVVEKYFSQIEDDNLITFDYKNNNIPYIVVCNSEEIKKIVNKNGEFKLVLCSEYPNTTPFNIKSPKGKEINFASFDIISLCKYDDGEYIEYYLDIASTTLFEFRQQLGLEGENTYYCTLAHSKGKKKDIVRSSSFSIDIEVNEMEKEEAIKAL